MKTIIYVLLCFLYIIGPVLNTSLGLYGDPILYISFLLTLYLFGSKFCVDIRPRLFLGLFEKPLILFQFYLVFPLLGAIILAGYGDKIGFSDIFRPTRIILTMYAGLALVLVAYKLYDVHFFAKIMKIIVFVMVLNAIVMCLQTIFEPFRIFMNTILFRIDDGVDRYGIELRASGLFLSGGALPSVFQTIITVFIPYLIVKKEFSYFGGLLLALFLFATSIFTGRSGMLSIIPFIYVAYIFFPKTYFFRMILLIFGSTILFISYIGLFESEAFIYAIERFSWLANESKESGTIAVILNKWSIPDDVYIFLFGVLNFNNAIYSHVSDMGFNIKLWTYGILGSILYYMTYFKMFLYVYRFKSTLYKDERILVIIFLLTYLMFEFKENMMYARNGLSILSLIIYGYTFYRYNVNRCVGKI